MLAGTNISGPSQTTDRERIEHGLKTPNYGDENHFSRKWADDHLRGALDH